MSEVKVSLNAKDEIALMNRFGRRCSPETLIKRAVAEVLRMQADNVAIFEGAEEYRTRIAKESEELDAETKAVGCVCGHRRETLKS